MLNLLLYYKRNKDIRNSILDLFSVKTGLSLHTVLTIPRAHYVMHNLVVKNCVSLFQE